MKRSPLKALITAAIFGCCLPAPAAVNGCALSPSAAIDGCCPKAKSEANLRLPPLKVKGRNLVAKGKPLLLHGVMDTPSCWFNNGRWGWSYDEPGRERCLNYFDRLYTLLTDRRHGARCNVFRLHLEPAWTNDPQYHYCDKTGDGEADIQHFNPNRLRTYLRTLYFPLMKSALSHGLYVVVRPPGVCPGEIRVGGIYQKYLLEVWDIVSRDDSLRRYSGQISIELANEPVRLLDADGNDTPRALHDFFQPIVDKIRANGFDGIIWAPGTLWQQNYRSYAVHPIEDPLLHNIGYAVHDYVGWYGTSDEHCDPASAIRNFRESVPVVDDYPIIITEVDWSPEREGSGHVNEMGKHVHANLGTWSTGTSSRWGKAYQAVVRHYGNISMTLSGTHCYIDVDESLKQNRPVPAFNNNPEACAAFCFRWYKNYK